MNDMTSDVQVRELAQAQLAAIVESSDDAILSKDLDGTIRTWNMAAERLYGFTAEEMIGTSVARIMPPENPDEFSKIMERLKRGEKIDHYDTVRIHKDGHRVEVSVSISPMAGPDGTLVGAASIAREIGGRKRLEAERRDAANRVSRLQEVTAALSEALTPDHVAQVVVRQAVEALGAWAGVVGLVDGDTLKILSSAGYSPEVMAQWKEIPLSGAYPVTDAVLSRRAVWIESRDEYRHRYPDLAETIAVRTSSAIVVPLLVRSHAIGALGLSFSESRRFLPEVREFVQALAHQCAQALERARLYEAEHRARQRAALLAEASGILSSSMECEETVSSVARALVPDLADWCVVHLLEADGSLNPLAVSNEDPERVSWVLESQRRNPPEVHRDRGLGLVLRTGESVVYNDIPGEMPAEAASGAERLGIPREMGPCSVLMAPLIARGRTLGVLTLMRDDHCERYSEADLAMAEDLAHRIAMAVDNARLFRESQELNRAKDEFQAMLAHELRNPIGAISNALYLMDQADDRGAARDKRIGIASRQLRHVTRLLDDLLDVSRITRGKVRLRVEPVELAEVVEAAIQAAQPVIERRGHRLMVDFPDEPLVVQGDADRLQQIVRNLLDNAAKFTPHGGNITVCLERAGGEAILRIRDNGTGIPKDLLPHIFDMFAQADRALDRPEGGLGIGLTLVKSLVELHGGSVEAASPGPGRGTVLTVRLKLVAAGLLPEDDHQGQREITETVSKGRRVLLVEDNPDAADTMTEILEMWGHSVQTAPDGPTALRLFQENELDIVLLDIGLPGMDGFEVGRRLRELEGARRSLMVALSGYNQPDDRARSHAAGFDHHLPKPVDATILRSLLADP